MIKCPQNYEINVIIIRIIVDKYAKCNEKY